MVKNLPTIERSTKIRFGRNCKDDQAENTIVFNASNVQIDATIPGAIYMTPLRVQEDLADTNVTMMTYNTATKEIMDSGVLASDVLAFDLEDVTLNGNITSNAMIFKGNTAFITYSNTAGISNTEPVHTLDVGSNLYIQDTGSDVLNVTGNANVTDKLTTKTLHVTEDARISGNLDVAGVLTTLRTDNTIINDAIIEIANNNTVSTTDMGLIMSKPETNVGIGYRGDENEFMVGFTQSDASNLDLVPDSSNLIQMRVYGDLHVSNAFDVATRASVGSNVVIDDDASEAVSVTGNVYASRAVKVGSNAIVDTLASNVISVTGNTYTSHAVIVGANTVIDDLATDVVSVTGNAYVSHAIDVGSNIVLDDQSSDVLSLTGNAYVSRGIDVGSNVMIDDLASDSIRVIGNIHSSRKITVGTHLTIDTLDSNVVQVTGNTFTSRASIIGSNIVLDDQASNVVEVTGNARASRAVFVGSNVAIDDLSEDVVSLTGNAYVSHAIDVGSNVVIDDLAPDVVSLTGNAYVSRAIDVGSNVVIDDLASNVLSITGDAKITDTLTANYVSALEYYGDGGLLANVTLQVVSDKGNATSNTIQFTNPTTAFATDLTSNVEVKLDQLNSVTINGLEEDNLLVYDGNKWTNEFNLHNFIKVRNETGVNMKAGNVVYVTNFFNNNIANVALAKSDSDSTMPAIGMLHTDLDAGHTGVAVAYGKVTGVNTSGYTEGQTVYVSNTAAGTTMNTKPYGLDDKIQNVGICIRVDASNGIIFVTGVGRSNDIPNAPIETTTSPYVYVNTADNNLRKIVPSNLLTKLQTLDQVVNTGNTVSNIITASGFTTTGNVNIEQNISVGGLTVNRIPVVGADNYLVDSSIRRDNGNIIISADTEITGNLFVTGNSYVVSSNELVIQDRIIGLANNNPSHDFDAGIIIEHPGHNIGLIHHGDEDRFSMGYTQNSFTDNHVLPDSNLFYLNVLGNLEVQNNFFVNERVGISNLAPQHDLAVGSNLYVDDDGSDVVVVTGNVSATRFIGDGAYLSNIASTFEDIIINGNVTSNTVHFENATSIVTTGKVGISNAAPGHDLAIGSNLYVDDDGEHVVVVTGNVVATRFIGDGAYLSNIASSLEDIVINGNTTSNVVEFHGETALITSNGVGIANSAPEHDLSVGSNLYVDDTGSSVIVVSGNVSATRFIGDGAYLSNIASTFEDIIINGNVTSNTVHFENATSIVTTGNVGISNATPEHDLSIGSNLYVDDDGSNVLVIYGNAAIDALTLGLGEVGIVPSYGLNHVTAEYNQTGDTIVLTNATTGLVVDSNINVGSNIVFTSGGAHIQGLRVAPTASNIVTYDATTGEVFDSGGLISNKLAVVSEQPPSALSGASTTIANHGVYAVSTSASDAYKAFDKTTTHWTSGTSYTGIDNAYNGSSELFSGGELGEWVKIQLPYKTTLRHVSVTPAVSVESFPGTAYIYASNDDITWTQLKTWSSVTPSSLTDVKKFAVDASAGYSYYAIVPTKAAGASTSVNIGEWKLFTESFTIDGGIMNTTAQISLDSGIQSNLEVGTANLFVDVVNSKIGVGTKTPTAKFEVDGSVKTGALTASSGTVTGDLTVQGDFIVTGSTITVDQQNLSVEDPIIELGKGNAGAGDLGIVMTRPSGGNFSNVAIVYDESLSNLEIGYTLNGATDSTIAMDTGNALSVNINGNLNVTDTFASTSKFTGALKVAGGVGVVGNVYVGENVAVGSNVGIGTTSPRSILDVNDTGAMIVPSGTSAERPSTGINGMLRYNSYTGYFETYTVSGWGSLATPPSIASFTPTVVDTGTSSGTQITVSGSFFDQNSSIKLRGSDGTEYSTTSFSFTSTTSISATLPFLPSTNSPYTVVVTTGSGLSTESTDTLVSGNTPVWSSPAAGATVYVYTIGSTTITLSATDADGDTLTYSIVSGTLPSGLTLSGNQISGTSTASVGSTSTITVRASDGELYADRTFTIETKERLYAFTSHTFTNAGQTGRTGPTLTQLRNAYTPSWTDDANYLNVVTQGFQEWTVPATGTYEIEVAGASGGDGNQYTAGKGAYMRGNFQLSIYDKLFILVGQKGLPSTGTNLGGGGGGGTFVTIGTQYSTSTALIVSGGGGGAGRDGNYTHGNGGDAPTTNTGTGGGASGTYGGGGGGFVGDGSGTGNGISFINGATGGYDVNGSSNYQSHGGFGGGGSNNIHLGGGGGGYNGGRGGTLGTTGSTNGIPSGGGGSYNSGSSQNNIAGNNIGHGYATITLL